MKKVVKKKKVTFGLAQLRKAMRSNPNLTPAVFDVEYSKLHPAKNTSNRLRELLCDQPELTRDEAVAILRSEGYPISEITVCAVYYDVRRTQRMLKDRGWKKP